MEVFTVNLLKVILHALYIFASTCIMIVPGAICRCRGSELCFLDIFFACLFCMCRTKHDVCYRMDLQFASLQAVPMNAVLRIGNKTLCESIALNIEPYTFCIRLPYSVC